MKKQLLIIFTLIISYGYAQTYVPDDNFEQALINLGYDTGALDDFVPTANIASVLTLDVSNQGITDFTGIASFDALNTLNINDNNAATIDLRFNNFLASLSAYNAGLTTIRIGANTNLQTYNVTNNNLTDLDIDLAINIVTLYASNNALVNLDLSQHTLLQTVGVEDNDLEDLLVNSGNNAVLTSFNATNNKPYVCIAVDNEVDANAGNGVYISWQKDATTTYNGIACLTYVPDDDFEQNLINAGVDSGALDDYALTGAMAHLKGTQAQPFVTSNLGNSTGIEALISIEYLGIFASSTLTSIDFTNNTNLITLGVFPNNPPQQISITLGASHQSLTNLIINNCELATIDVNNYSNLEHIDLGFNQLTLLDVSNLSNLEFLEITANQLTALDVRSNPLLSNLNTLNNSSLSCISVIDENAANAGTGNYLLWVKDAVTIYSNNCAALGVEDFNTLSDIALYPNPTENSFIINSSIIIESVKLYSILGKQVAIFSNQNQYDISTLQSGVYFAIITSEGNSITKKIIKN